LGERSFTVEFTVEGRADLKGLKASDMRRVVSAIMSGLQHQPFAPTRNRKQLDEIEPAFAFDPPLWELRIGDFRVFFDGLSAEGRIVTVRAIRRKGPTQTTQEIVS
jgi:mRNA-degrading endonuclease RelE of RelBE toxin-antitoxin system